MSVLFDTIKVNTVDKKRMMKECKELFLKSHPELKGMNITQRFMFNKLIDFYLK